MGYNDSDAGTTVFGKKSKKKKAAKKSKAPKAKKAKKAKTKKAKKPCKYGPRDADGYCPKKPSRFADSGLLDDEPKPRKKSAAAKRRSTAKINKYADAIYTGVSKAAAETFSKKENRERAKELASGLANLPVGAALKGGAVGAALLSGVALAGIAAFAATHYIITRRARNKEEKEQAAYEAALAYRQARADAVAKQGGKPLTAAQQQLLASAFKTKLMELGISSSKLR